MSCVGLQAHCAKRQLWCLSPCILSVSPLALLLSGGCFSPMEVFTRMKIRKKLKKQKGPGKKAESCLTCFEHQRKIEAVTIVLTVVTSTTVVRL